MRRKIWSIFLLVFAALGCSALLVFADQTVSSGDQKFFMEAASGGMLEVELGQMAQQKAQAVSVKDFGTRMVTDHGKANDELKALAQKKNLQMPTQLEHKHRSMIEKLAKLSGPAFDKKYLKMMVKDHEKDVKEFQKATKKVKDADLNAWAAKTLPTLEQHLQQAKEVYKGVK
jgi:putative membrane protein